MVNNLTIRILEPFLTRSEEPLHLADISRQLKEPHPTVRLHLNALEKKGILRKSYKGRLTLYSLNLDNPLLLEYLVVTEKNKLIRACEKHLVLKELTHFLRNISGKEMIIFGSAAQNFIKANDIDLLVTGKTDEKKIQEFSERYNKQIHLINVKDLKKVTETLKKEIIKKHLVIKGSENVVWWLFWRA